MEALDTIKMKVEIRRKGSTKGKLVMKLIFDAPEKSYRMGRSSKYAQLVLKDEKASRAHIEIKRVKNRIWIKDLKTKNGTKVNMAPLKYQALYEGDVINIGSHEIVVTEIYEITADDITSFMSYQKVQSDTKVGEKIRGLI